MKFNIKKIMIFIICLFIWYVIASHIVLYYDPSANTYFCNRDINTLDPGINLSRCISFQDLFTAIFTNPVTIIFSLIYWTVVYLLFFRNKAKS